VAACSSVRSVLDQDTLRLMIWSYINEIDGSFIHKPIMARRSGTSYLCVDRHSLLEAIEQVGVANQGSGLSVKQDPKAKVPIINAISFGIRDDVTARGEPICLHQIQMV